MKFNRRFSRAQVKSRRLQVQTLCRACASACDVGLYMSDLFLSSEILRTRTCATVGLGNRVQLSKV